MSNDTAIASIQEKIDDLNQQAWEARVNDSQKAFEFSQESVELSRSINYPKGLAEGLRSLGFAYVRLFKNDEAAPLLQEALSLFQSLNDLKGQAIVYEYLGIIERNWGNLGASLEFLLKGNALCQQTGPQEIEITSCYQVGVTYKHLGNYEDALEYLYKALSLSKKINFTLMEAYATNIIGSIYFDNGDYKHALDCYQQALFIRQQSNDKWGEAGSLDNIGFAYLKLNDIDRAIDYCKQSLEITQATGDKKGEANTLLHLAEIYQQAGDISQASKFSNESLEIRKTRGDKRGEAEVLLFLAVLHKQASDVGDQQITDWLFDALKIADEIKAQDLVSKTYYNLYEYYREKGNYKESLVPLEAHLQIEKELHKKTIDQKIANLEITHKAETISQRNKELIKLNEKINRANEELKIEASLERVRAVTMSMSKPDDILNICRVMFAELQALNFKDLRNALINFWDDKHGLLLDYDYSDFSGGNFAKISYNSHPVFEEFQKKVRKATDAFAELVVSESELETWKQRRRDSGEYEDPRLNNISALYYYFYSTGVGALGISTLSPIPKDKLEVLKRFRNVFDLTYRRYLDIVKAEAQAKEAQIELALERVRAKAMAMQDPAEFVDVINVIGEQFIHLDFDIEWVNFGANGLDITSGIDAWNFAVVPGGEPVSSRLFIPRFDHPLFKEGSKYLDEYRKTGNDLFVISFDKREKDRWLDHMFTNTIFKDVPVEYRAIQYAKPGYTTSNLALKDTFLSIGKFDTRSFTDEQHAILKRFGNAFGQAYTRFLDLQKAEAQVREAKIEAALERTRTQSMIMQHSKELDDVLRVFHEQVLLLGIPSAFSFLWLPDEKNDRHIFWAVWEQSENGLAVFKSKAINYPLDRNEPATAQCLIDWKSSEPVFSYHVPPAAVENYFAVWQELIDGVEHLKPGNFSDGLHYVEAFMKYGCFGVMVSTDLTEDEKKLLTRFAIEFERTYTRFLDLQKAEAQTREAQIQLSLERVRARAMSMYHSDELNDVLTVLFEQFITLGINPVFAHLSLFDLEKNSTTLRITGKGGAKSMAQKTVDIDAMQEWKEELANWKASKPSSISRIYYPKEVLPEIWTLFGDLFDQLPEDSKIYPEDFKDGLYCIQGNTGFGYIGLNHTREATEEEKDIIYRFAIEFGRMYQRFLDLQKAEAQAREAQIETALERVRSRTMGMQRSDELPLAANLLFQQIQSLGIHAFSTGYNIWEEDKKNVTSWMSSEDIIQPSFKLPLTKEASLIECYEAAQRGDALFVQELGGTKLDSHLNYMQTLPVVGELMKKIAKAGFPFPNYMINHHAFFSHGYLLFITYEPVPEAHEIFKRFAKVFEQTYTRFLDLKKAEAQTREAQIETGLERVRSKTMAMHKSEEVTAVAVSLNEELLKLGFEGGSTIIIINRETGDTDQWTGFSEDKSIKSCYVPYFEHPYHDALLNSWKKGESFLAYTIAGDEKRSLDEHYFTTGYNIFPESDKKWMKAMESVTFSHAFMKYGAIHWGPEQLTEEQLRILQRFSKVFEQSYTRFLDLQKAEAQAREAQIEAALERIRSVSMAIRKSNELFDIIHTVFGEWKKLGLELYECNINLLDRSKKEWTNWGTGIGEAALPRSFQFPWFDDPFVKQLYEDSISGISYRTYVQEGEELKRFLDGIFTYTDFKNAPEEYRSELYSIPKMYLSHAFMQYGSMDIVGPEQPPATTIDILKRFAKVFEQAYTRYLDVVNAEAQAREAQIEASLERVRARTMAMQKSEELPETSLVLYEQLKQLGEPAEQLTIGVVHEENNVVEISATLHGGVLNKIYWHSIDEPFMMNKVYQAWKTQQKTLIVELKGDQLNAYNKYRNELTKSEMFQTDFDDEHRRIVYAAFFSKGLLAFAANEPRPPQSLELLERFASVFDLTYTRFLDLQKAEAQAREAQIETALERVRSRSMGMQKSDELKEVIKLVYQQLIHLKINLDHAGFVVDYKPKGDWTFWIADEQDIPSKISHPYFESVWATQFNEAKEKGTDLFTTHLNFEEKNKFYDELLSYVPGLPEVSKEFYLNCPGLAASTALFDNIALYIENFSGIPYTDEENKTLMRFGKVFQQTYTRFLDLQKAEGQAREAQIEVALERVRSKVMAMNSSKDLTATSLVFGEQLRKLNIDWQFSYFWLIDEAKNETTFWITWPDYKTSFTSYTLAESERYFNDCLVSWRAGVKIHDNYVPPDGVQDWLDTFQRIADDAGGVAKEIMVASTFPTGVYYYDAMMKYGSFGICVSKPSTDEEKNIQGRFAIEFERAYTRFIDLKTAEAHAEKARLDLIQIQTEKKRAEDALAELQNTQKQLIQAEKMASLGELTAGIAHEIQNPLNFVNNFSDVSNELLEEMKQELASGNTQQALALVNDVKDNLEKILHHGKRADAIVKGMLQHSRTSSGQKELTDINLLADEYLRLAYHGLRAKDKFFNAKFETDLDPSVNKINVVPQEIGRVILNLINNSFYAVNEKKKTAANGYDPVVSVSTRKVNDTIEIKVKDNGNGIPQKVLDKIFQPFFTTKPTGQGTGLGLSLSYDIITKGHSGEIKVITSEGNGSEFIISLPAN